ncbi:hypothetical protein ACHQM5_006176 [Ranunculus cassubicifolius]
MRSIVNGIEFLVSIVDFLKAKFNLEDYEMKNVLSSMGDSWKKYKSTLTRKYIMLFKDQPGVIAHVSRTYKKSTEQAVWDLFVVIRLREEFQA